MYYILMWHEHNNHVVVCLSNKSLPKVSYLPTFILQNSRIQTVHCAHAIWFVEGDICSAIGSDTVPGVCQKFFGAIFTAIIMSAIAGGGAKGLTFDE